MIIKKVFCAVLFCFTSACMAGTQTGAVEALHVRGSDGVVYFILKGAAKTAAPACASNRYWMIKDENSAAGKRQYSLLLAAQLSGVPIVVTGTNTCTRWVDGEDVDVISLLT